MSLRNEKLVVVNLQVMIDFERRIGRFFNTNTLSGNKKPTILADYLTHLSFGTVG